MGGHIFDVVHKGWMHFIVKIKRAARDCAEMRYICFIRTPWRMLI